MLRSRLKMLPAIQCIAGASASLYGQEAPLPPTVLVDDVSMPVLIMEMLPSYPRRAMKARVEAQVVLRAVIRTDGSLGGVRVIRCDRKRFGFEKAAVEALEKWRFEPARQGGEPVEVSLTTTIRFAL